MVGINETHVILYTETRVQQKKKEERNETHALIKFRLVLKLNNFRISFLKCAPDNFYFLQSGFRIKQSIHKKKLRKFDQQKDHFLELSTSGTLGVSTRK